MVPARSDSRSQSNRGSSTQLHTNAVLEFEERLEAIKVGLSQGVDVVVWEGNVCLFSHMTWILNLV